MCNKGMAYSDNYCGSCGRKNSKEFKVYEVPLAVQNSDISSNDINARLSAYIEIHERVPWHGDMPKVKRVTILPSFKNVTNIKSTSCWFSCDECDEKCTLQFITGLENLNTSNVRYMTFMFNGCEWIHSLNLSRFDTSQVRDMSGMFGGCKLLTTLDLTHFNTTNVRYMTLMFSDCERITTLNLSSFNTQNVIDMLGMFAGCKKLTSLNVSSFNTRNVKSMVGMFWGCELMPSLNISSFNMSRVEATMRMFEDCKALQIIYASSSGWNLDRARRNHNLDNYCILFVDHDYGTEDMYKNCPAKVVWR
jgi:surface protein